MDSLRESLLPREGDPSVKEPPPYLIAFSSLLFFSILSFSSLHGFLNIWNGKSMD
jgi:hypothetical protein